MNWYLLQTKSNSHRAAYKNLKRQGFDVFLPLIHKTTKKNGKFLDCKAPLFPGYVFMGTSIDPIPWTSINGTRGISKAVTLDGVYRPLNNDIIKGLRCRCNDCGVIQNIDEISDNERSWVLIELLQQQTRAEISLGFVSKIN